MNRFAAPLRPLLLVLLCLSLALGGGRQAMAGDAAVAWPGGQICGSGEGMHGSGPDGPMAPGGDHGCCVVCLVAAAAGPLGLVPAAVVLLERDLGRATRLPLPDPTRRNDKGWIAHPGRAPPAA